MKTTNQIAIEVIESTTVSLALSPATPMTLEDNLEGIIVAAAGGDQMAKRMLRPVINRIARSQLAYVDAADRVASIIVARLGCAGRGVGKPRPGNAVRWLESVVRAYAGHDFEETSLEQWEEWNPPPQPEEPERKEE